MIKMTITLKIPFNNHKAIQLSWQMDKTHHLVIERARIYIPD